jgi:hypothetical protein
MPTTGFKGWVLPTVGGSAGTWGTELNAAMAVADNNLGGFVSVALSSIPVTLSAVDTGCLIIRLSGALTANVTVTLTPVATGPAHACGFWFVENTCTGAFTAGLSNGVGSVANAPQGLTSLLIADVANGCRLALSDNFPAGQTLITAGTAAPAGWTKGTTHNNKALRLITGAVSTGGSSAFTSVFGARTIALANMPVHNHTVTDPGHTHAFDTYLNYVAAGVYPGSPLWYNSTPGVSGPSTTGITINNSGSGTAMDFDVQYVDVTLIQKNA